MGVVIHSKAESDTARSSLDGSKCHFKILGRAATLKTILEKPMTLHEFEKESLLFDLDGSTYSVQGQTLLKNYRSGKINTENYTELLKELGLVNQTKAVRMVKLAKVNCLKNLRPQKLLDLASIGGIPGLKCVLLSNPALGTTTTLPEFKAMTFTFNGNGRTFTGQTILRRIGTRKRTESNFNLILSAMGFTANFNNPEHIRRILSSIKEIDLETTWVNEFCCLDLNSNLFKGSGSAFLHKALSNYIKEGYSTSVAFELMLKNAGISRNLRAMHLRKNWLFSWNGYPKLSKSGLISALFLPSIQERYLAIIELEKDLRKLLETGKTKGGKKLLFEGRPVTTPMIWEAVFTLPSKETIRGQALLMRFGKPHVSTIEFLLSFAGYARPNMVRKRVKTQGTDRNTKSLNYLLKRILTTKNQIKK